MPATQTDVSDARLLELVRRVPDMLCIAGPDGRFHWVSPQFAEQFEYTPDELLAIPFLDLVHPGDQARAIAAVQDLAKGGYNFEVELRARRASGEYRWLQWNSAGDPGGLFYCCARDITDRKSSEVRLAERSRLLEMGEALAGVGHWRLPLGEETLTWSPQVYEIYGRDPASYRPTVPTAVQAYHEDDRELVNRCVTAALETGEGFEFEARIVRPDGEIRHVRSAGVPEFGADGEVEAVFGVFQDVTEQRLMAETVRRSERMASLGTMAAGIAHEINNPLGYLVGNLQLVQEELQDLEDRIPSSVLSDLSEMLGSALDGGNRIRRIVENMRQFSHLGTAELRPVRLDDIVDAACEMAMHQVHPRARLVRHVEPAPPVRGDETQLTQVLVNLLVNAAQALPVGEAEQHRIEVSLLNRVDGLQLRVRDTGPGVPDEIRTRVFDPFFTTKPVGTGTGLGLTIAHSIVTGHGGSLTLENAADGGCVATLVLPTTAEQPVDPPEPALAPARTGPRPRLLIVDDEVQTLRLLQRALARDFEVVTVDNGQDAIETISADPAFDLVLCDLMMPKVSGMEVHGHLRERNPGLAERFIIATGGAFTPEGKAFLVASGVPVLRKPFDLPTLRETLRDRVSA